MIAFLFRFKYQKSKVYFISNTQKMDKIILAADILQQNIKKLNLTEKKRKKINVHRDQHLRMNVERVHS